MKTPLLRKLMLATVLLAAGAACAQGPARGAPGRAAPAASPTRLGYGAGYHARQLQQAEAEERRARRAAMKTDDECALAATQHREQVTVHAKQPGLAPAPH